MKQYTTPEQTAKLIELGFDKPKNTQYIQRAKARNLHSPFIEFGEPEFEGSYSIGELIEMLPQYLEYGGGVAGIEIDYYALTIRQNVVMYCDPYMDWIEIQCDDHKELIDNLYDMETILKEEEVI